MTGDTLTPAQERVIQLLQQGYTVTRSRKLGLHSTLPAKAWKRHPDGHYMRERITDATLESLRAAGLIEHQRHEATIYVRLAQSQAELDLQMPGTRQRRA
ncbi:MAG: hypothetical protein JWL62_1403 [Hyphomicrobiales bacterium]|nr:hypothetical protein [Hyphomicrobiales bacterium]